MSDFLPKLREEIKKNYSDAVFFEVYGSLIQPYIGKPVDAHWFYLIPIEGENPFQKKWHCQSIPQISAHYAISNWRLSVVTAMEALAYHHKVDAIYWFTDMKDKANKSANDEGMKLLEKMIETTGVKLYIQTAGLQPSSQMRALVKKSGGEINRKKIK
jgi:hypothetical protein